MGYRQVIFKTDSDMVVKCIQGKFKPPLNLFEVYKECKSLMQARFHTNHIWRQGNRADDTVAKGAHTHKATRFYVALASLYSNVNNIVQQDAKQYATFR